MGSFSKIFAPGLRIGWALVPAHLQQRYYLASGGRHALPAHAEPDAGLCVPARLRLAGQIETYRGLYQERCRHMLAALAEYMPAGRQLDPAVTAASSSGSPCPSGVDTYPLLQKAIDAGVVFIPGAAFTSVPGASNKLRLAFSSVPPENIREGVRRLAPVLRDAVEARG